MLRFRAHVISAAFASTLMTILQHLLLVACSLPPAVWLILSLSTLFGSDGTSAAFAEYGLWVTPVLALSNFLQFGMIHSWVAFRKELMLEPDEDDYDTTPPTTPTPKAPPLRSPPRTAPAAVGPSEC